MKLIQLVRLRRIGNHFSTELWINVHLPRNRIKGFKTHWITNELLQVRRERNYDQTKGQKTRSQYHWQMYRKLCSHINRLEKKLKFEHFCRMIEENKNKSLHMWIVGSEGLRTVGCLVIGMAWGRTCYS